MTNEIDKWPADFILRTWDATDGMPKDVLCRLSQWLGHPSSVWGILCGWTGVEYLQSWDIYMWGEPNESSLLLRNERGR